jgi:hypothetical protein
MFKRAVSIVLLLTTLNYMVGCTKTVRTPANEIAGRPGKIVGVVLHSEEVISFDDAGGTYDRTTGKITGVDVNGVQRTSDLREIARVQIEKQGDRETRVSSLTVRQFRDQYRSLENTTLLEAVLKNGLSVRFPHRARYIPQERVFVGKDQFDMDVKIPLEDISYVLIKRTDVVMTFVAIAVVAVLVTAFVVMVSENDEPPPPSSTESCPFVYSHDGEQWILDAEPLGGATARAFERTDYSVMEHIRPVSNELKLLVRNETEEIQHLDELGLMLVDCPVGYMVAPDGSGDLQLVDAPLSPSAAYDETGTSILNFVTAMDTICWQTDMPTSLDAIEEDYRHHLTFRFDKPADATRARLVYTAGTSLWGSRMIREMVQARGSSIDDWYQALERRGPQLLETFSFFDREELFWLKVRVDRGTDTVERGHMLAGGPLVYDTRIVDLDLADVTGDSLVIHVDPPRGYWTIDYMAVEYDIHPAPTVAELPMIRAVNQNKEDVAASLAVRDGTYYVMPTKEDLVALDFGIPAGQDMIERAVVLKSSGYYNLIIDKTLPEESELIRATLATPGAIVRHTLARYVQWTDSLLAEK